MQLRRHIALKARELLLHAALHLRQIGRERLLRFKPCGVDRGRNAQATLLHLRTQLSLQPLIALGVHQLQLLHGLLLLLIYELLAHAALGL